VSSQVRPPRSTSAAALARASGAALKDAGVAREHGKLEPQGRLLARGFEVLFALARFPTGARLADLSDVCAIPRPTTFRILQTLVGVGAVAFDSTDRRYRIGSAIQWLSEAAGDAHDVARSAQPHLERLRDATGETACVFGRNRMQRVCIASAISKNDLGFQISPGQVRELLVGAPGRVIAAYLPDEERRRLLDPLSPTRRRTLLDQFAAIERDRMAYSADEIVLGGAAIAVPILDEAGRSSMALTLLGPSARLTATQALAFEPLLQQTAASIAALLGPGPGNPARSLSKRDRKSAPVKRPSKRGVQTGTQARTR
jgi:DNA-binding IclR family transcriptional regulator